MSTPQRWLKSVTDSQGRAVRYDAYDRLGQRDLVTLLPGTADEKMLDYGYDAKGRLQTIATAAGTFTFGYDGLGRRGTLAFPNGVSATYGYDPATNWLSGITYAAGGANLLFLGYPQHDKVGNRKERKEDAASTLYGYDALYQLLAASTGPEAENYTYDPVGNRQGGPTVKDTAAAAYEHDDANRMLQGRKFTYSYDELGNQSARILGADKRWDFTWDGDSRLTKAELKSGGATLRTVSFKYDPFGRRIEKKVEGLAPQVPVPVTTTYLYDGEDIVLEYVNNGATTTTTHYVHGPGIDEPLAMVRGGQAYYYHADGLGSVIAITDSAKAIKQRYTYESFGMLTPQDPAFDNAYTYTGREWDKEIGLYYYRARYYDPMEGRFISRDPIGFAGGDVNLYGYVWNRSANNVDPSGLHGPNDKAPEGSISVIQTGTCHFYPQSHIYNPKRTRIYLGGSLQGSGHLAAAGVSGSEGGVYSPDGRVCESRTVCQRTGPGAYYGSGVVGSIIITGKDIAEQDKTSIGPGLDVGPIGIQILASDSTLSLSVQLRPLGGEGASVGIDKCEDIATSKCRDLY